MTSSHQVRHGHLIQPLRMLWRSLAILAIGSTPAIGFSQWLGYPTPGIPRTASGAPNMKAPAPRTRDGKPDFSGIWFANVPAKDYCKEKDCIQEERMAREQINLGIKMQGGLPYTEWSKQQMVKRRANGGGMIPTPTASRRTIRAPGRCRSTPKSSRRAGDGDAA